MERVTFILSQPWVRDLGWTFVQFLWQGTILACVFAIARRFFSVKGRYLLAVGTLVAMAAAPVLTFTAGLQVALGISWPVSGGIGWEALLPKLAVLWAVGTLFFSIRLACIWRSTFLLRKTGIETAPPEWQNRFRKLAARMGVADSVQLLLSSRVNTPATTGWLRPLVFFPASLLTGLSASHIEALLAHELAHVKRMDYAVNILQSVAEAILFYHPAVWWVSKQIRTEREFICDDLAAAACGDTLEYARALAELESARLATFALAASEGPLLARIRRLLTPEATASTAPLAATAIAMSVLWIMSASAVMAQPPASAKPVNAAPPVEVAKIAAPPAAAVLFAPFGPVPQAPTTSAAVGFSGAIVDDGTGSAAASVTVGLYRAGSSVMAAEFETDSSGRFGPVHLPDGDYRLEASKTNYISVRKPVTLKGGALDTTLRMVRTGVVTGKVVDAKNQPVYGAVMMAIPKPRSGEVLQSSVLFRSAAADAAGVYRIFGIPPGEYAIMLTFGNSVLMGEGAITVPTPSRLGSGFELYPTTAHPEFVAIDSGTEVPGIDFKMQDSGLFDITGTVESPAPLARFGIALQRDGLEGMIISYTTINPGASFRFTGIPGGVYRLVASRLTAEELRPAGSPPSPAPESMYGTMRLELSALSNGPVRLQVSPGRTARFSLTAAQGCQNTVTLVLMPPQNLWPGSRRQGQLTAGAPLQLTGLAPGRYLGRVQNPGPGCYAPDFPLDLTQGSPEEPRVVTVGRTGAVHGTVAGVTEPSGELTVMLTPIDGSPADTVTLSARGEFTFDKVPPGQYRLGVYRGVARATSTTVIDVAPDAAVEVALPAPAAR